MDTLPASFLASGLSGSSADLSSIFVVAAVSSLVAFSAVAPWSVTAVCGVDSASGVANGGAKADVITACNAAGTSAILVH